MGSHPNPPFLKLLAATRHQVLVGHYRTGGVYETHP